MRLITQMKADLRADGGIKSLVNDLLGLSTEVEDDMVEPGEEEPSIDVRLRYFDGAWSLHTGDVQYDTDHRGFWGSSSVGQEMTEDRLGTWLVTWSIRCLSMRRFVGRNDCRLDDPVAINRE